MISMLGERQQLLLHCLLRTADGMTVDDLARALAISHNAVRQHLVALEHDAFVERGRRRPSGGRPEQIFVLSARGRELFPRQYAFLSELLIDALAADGDAAALATRLRELGTAVGNGVRARAPATHEAAARIDHARAAMDELGYETRTVPLAHRALPELVAHNCVYQRVAAARPEVCDFDVALLGAATATDVEQVECLVRGGRACRFRFRERH